MTYLPSLEGRVHFWDDAARGHNTRFETPIQFEDPVHIERFSEHVERNARILDFGCGYGRVLSTLHQAGFNHLNGTDISGAMLDRAKREFPHLTDALYLQQEEKLPFTDNSFGAITVFTVLNNVPDDEELRGIFQEFERLLCEDGILYIDEFLTSPFDRDIARYEDFRKHHPEAPWGIFQHASGAVFRHFTEECMTTLLRNFDVLWHKKFKFVSMNGNPCMQGQWIARYRGGET